MAWQSVTVGDALDRIKKQIQDSINTVSSEVNKIQDALNSVNNEIAAVQAVINANDSVIQGLAQSGIKFIVLSPGQGAWSDRLISAENAPSTSASFYSVVYASIAVAPDITAVTSSFNSILGGLNQTFQPPVVDVPSLSIPSVTPVKPPSHILPIDRWSDTSLGEVFPHLFDDLSKNNSELGNTLQSLINMKNNLESTLSSLQDFLNSLNNVLTNINNSGIFTVELQPDQGSWIDRMLSEPGAPPTSGQYSSGMAFVGLFTDFSQANDAYNNLIQVLKS